jgi:WD40 repeat protein
MSRMSCLFIFVGFGILSQFSFGMASDGPMPDGAVARLGGSSDQPGGARLPSVRGLAFSPDSRWLATRGEPGDPSQPRVIRIWDTKSWTVSKTLTAHETSIVDFAFSPDGRSFVAGQPEHGAGLQIWDQQTGKKRLSFDGGRGRFHFLPDGRRMAIVAAFGKNDVIRVHDLQTGKEVQRFVIDQNYKFSFSADGSKLLAVRTGGRSTVHVVELSTGKTLLRLDDKRSQPSTFTFSPDGRSVAAASSQRIARDKYAHRIIVWEITTGEKVYELTQHTGRILTMAFTPDGRFLATGSLDRTVRIWELATGKLSRTFTGHRGPVSALAFSQNGQWLASGSFDKTVLIWKTALARKSFLPQGPLDEKAMIKVWNDLASPTPLHAYRAIGRIASAEGNAVIKLKDRVTSILVPAQNKRVQQLIVELDDDDSIVRQRAMRELRKLRKIGKPILLKTMKNTLSAEVRYRIRRILADAKDSPRFSKGDVRRMLRVIHAAESVGGPEAKAMLELIIKDFPLPAVIRSAEDALKHLKTRGKR